MDDAIRQMLSKLLMSQGSSGEQSQDPQLLAQYQQAMAASQQAGQPPIPFEQWVQMQQQGQPGNGMV